MSTWTLRSLKILGTQAFRAVEHSGTWALQALYLADSIRINFVKAQYTFSKFLKEFRISDFKFDFASFINDI